MQGRISEQRSQEAYLLDVVTYYNQKLHFFNAIEEALDLSNEDDYQQYMMIQPEREHLWEMLDDLNGQLVDVQTVISNLEFENFILEDTFVNEDEENA